MITKRFMKMLVFIPLILAVPLIAMFFTNEVAWTAFDFVAAAGFLLLLAVSLELVWRISATSSGKWIGGLVVFILFILIWAELAVGIFGSPFAGS